MFSFKNNDRIFYELFSTDIQDTCTAAEMLEKLFKGDAGIDETIKGLDDLEHKCDRTVHKVIEMVNRSFVTPIDREDIFSLAKVMDTIIDSIQSTAHLLDEFSIVDIRSESNELCGLITRGTKELKCVIDELPNMKTSKVLHVKIVEVNRIENQGDEIYRKLIKNLFIIEKDPFELIKWKEIYETMEDTLDACEDVANAAEGIVTKNA